jgi:hypothetical protein
MKKPSTWRVVGVAAGFCVSLGATAWLQSISPEIYGIGNRIGLISALLCTFGASLYFWAVGFAYAVHELGWSNKACRYAGVAFLLPGSLLILSHPRPMTAAGFLLSQMWGVGFLARKIAFPEMSDEEAAAREPLPTMFPK